MHIMRALAFGSLVLIAPSLHAEKRIKTAKPETKLAVVDDEPMSQTATQNPDEIRTFDLDTRGTATPKPVAIDRDTPAPTTTEVKQSLPDAVMHQPSEPPDSPHAQAILADNAILELAAKQMRHERRALDGCAAEAQARNPQATGSVTLRFTVADRKVANLTVDSDTLHDKRLNSCLDKAGRALKFSLKQASFFWPVTISPTALR